jgi:hypothetical protein
VTVSNFDNMSEHWGLGCCCSYWFVFGLIIVLSNEAKFCKALNAKGLSSVSNLYLREYSFQSIFLSLRYSFQSDLLGANSFYHTCQFSSSLRIYRGLYLAIRILRPSDSSVGSFRDLSFIASALTIVFVH